MFFFTINATKAGEIHLIRNIYKKKIIIKMKKFVLLLLAVITVSSCSLEDDGQRYYYEVLPVESFEVPESFVLGQTYEIKVTYKKPSNCHIFNGFYYEKDLNTRIIGIQTTVLDNDDCQDLENSEPIAASFDFQVVSNGTYIFKFYKGEDAEGNNIFEEVEIPVY